MRRRTHGGKGTDKIGRDPTDCGRPARGGCGIVVCVGLSSSISDRTRYAFRDSSASGRKGVKIFEHYYLLHKACHGLLPRTRVANSPKSDHLSCTTCIPASRRTWCRHAALADKESKTSCIPGIFCCRQKNPAVFSFALPGTCSPFLLLIPLKEAQVQRYQPLTEHKDPLKVPR